MNYFIKNNCNKNQLIKKIILKNRLIIKNIYKKLNS